LETSKKLIFTWGDCGGFAFMQYSSIVVGTLTLSRSASICEAATCFLETKKKKLKFWKKKLKFLKKNLKSHSFRAIVGDKEEENKK
jgi:hypothetical protein